jgi:hypothetical protein
VSSGVRGTPGAWTDRRREWGSRPGTFLGASGAISIRHLLQLGFAAHEDDRRAAQVHPTERHNAVDRLEVPGLVKRASHPRDGRAVLKLSAKGKKTALVATELLNQEVFPRAGPIRAPAGTPVG